MTRTSAFVLGCGLVFAGPVMAQNIPQFDPLAPFSVTARGTDGRVEVLSGGQPYLCQMVETNTYMAVSGCKAIVSEDRLQLLRELDALRDAAQTAQAELDEARREAATLSLALSGMTVELDAVRANSKASAAQVKTLEAAMADLRAKADADLQAANARIAELNQDLDQMARDRAAAELAAEDALDIAGLRPLLAQLEKTETSLRTMMDDPQQVQLMARVGLGAAFAAVGDGCRLSMEEIQTKEDELVPAMLEAALAAPGLDDTMIDIFLSTLPMGAPEQRAGSATRLDSALQQVLQAGDIETFDRGKDALDSARDVLRDLSQMFETPEVIETIVDIDRGAGMAVLKTPGCN